MADENTNPSGNDERNVLLSTFDVSGFQERTVIYYGSTGIFLQQETSGDLKAGYLYMTTVDGTTQELGPVSDYYALREKHSVVPATYEDYKIWLSTLMNTTAVNAENSQGWAIGTKDGDATGWSTTNNSKYYADQSRGYADGKKLDGTTDSTKTTDNSKYFKDQSKLWANNGADGETPSASNNAKAYAKNAAGWAVGNDSSATGYSATNNSKYYKEESAKWAVGTSSGSGTSTNNSKYWAEQSKSYADGKDLSGTAVAARATDNASYFKDQAKLWANNGTDGTTPTSSNNAKAYADLAHKWTNNSTSSTDTPSATNNALQYAKDAKGWAVGSADSATGYSATNNAKKYSENASNSATSAKNWAVKSTNSGTASDTNCSEYYAESAHQWVDGTTGSGAKPGANDKTAKDYVVLAHQWATGDNTTAAPDTGENAKAQANDSKGWAIGHTTKSGEYSPTNNSKYYKDESAKWAVGTSSGSGTSTNNSKYWAGQSKSYANGKDLDGNTVSARTTDNASYFSDQAKKWANFGTDGTTPTATNNAKAYADVAHKWVDNSTSSSDTPSATNNALYLAKVAKMWACGLNGSITEPDANNKPAKDYATDCITYVGQALSYANTAKGYAIGDGTSTYAQNNAKYYAELIQDVTVQRRYAVSTSGTTTPTTGWSNWGATVTPEKGKYLWMEVKYTWSNNTNQSLYFVTYVGKDGDGTQYASTIALSSSDATTILAALNGKAANTNFAAASSSAAGAAGLVPAPAAGANTKFLRGDATWADIVIPEVEVASTAEIDALFT